MKTIGRMVVIALTAGLTSTAALGSDGMAYGITDKAWYAIASAFVLGLAAAAGTTAQGKAAAAAFEGIARNPAAADKMLVPMILGLALIESLVIFSFVISILIQGNIAG